MTSRIVVPVLIAALAAAAQDAWAENGPQPPFPGVTAETRRAGAPEEEAGTAALPAPDTASAEAAPEGPGEPAVTAGGSRLLRALAGSPGRDDMRAEDKAPVVAAEGCPRGLLRRLLAGAAGEADALSALGIEREILTLCRERQEVLTGLFEAEAALRELRKPPEPAAEKGAVTPPSPARQIAGPRVVPATRTGTPSPLRAALAAAEKADTRAGDTRAGDTRAGDTRAVEPQAPRYAWFSIIGAAGALRAGITDGAQVWFVREGDPLPGGVRVAAISGRPPGVRVAGGDGNGDDTLLPYRARPGGSP